MAAQKKIYSKGKIGKRLKIGYPSFPAWDFHDMISHTLEHTQISSAYIYASGSNLHITEQLIKLISANIYSLLVSY